jgi:2-polyprenyl-3-methyl-5-hydroxy-6-metoxy-1,4-benzoquinol methylase
MSKNRIAKEWDAIANHRCSQIASGKDISHDRVLIPSMLKLIKKTPSQRILDIGSGCGFLTAQLARVGKEVLGIDISKKMVLQAQERFSGQENLQFQHMSLKTFAASCSEYFDTVVSNMAISTMDDLNSALRDVFFTLKPKGHFLFSITHPCFWNCYRQAETLDHFDYWKEHAVTVPFQITFEPKSRFKTTYFHRSLAAYLNALVNVGFRLEGIVEPKAPSSTPKQYQHNFRFPRFLLISARKP